MLGNLLSKIRKDYSITKTTLSKLTNINIGHLTHIEKTERNPSHKALKNICLALDLPYQPLFQTYDKKINQTHLDYKISNHISYNTIPVFDNITDLISCSSNKLNASFAFKVKDISMEPLFPKDSYAYVELNSPLNNNDFGLFKYNNEIIFRQFIIDDNNLILKTLNSKNPEIILSADDNFIIIGKVINN